MSLRAPEFFAELRLPFPSGTAVGNTYYATPIADAPLRLQISFTDTMYRNTYGGLRLTVMHVDRGKIDAVALSFADHGTFHRRKGALHHRNMPDTFNITLAKPGQPPWEGADTTGLRDAIQRYAAVWFPGAWTESAPSRAAGRTARPALTLPAARSGTRAR
ncbi:hypothetical protein AQJ30_07170 [Streptomyces longwoodensis]|uniref:Uncharacterized protein n=1 Tax=Streptomyces longwoodensis TaxID=68231 RepID=A0A124HS36_9ACTN|nr:hypothetical protein [Streptomyces longwoodensis]KUN40423.1 hypothetical protein AQJ30_07170 [Streptomyces longwoodensis]